MARGLGNIAGLLQDQAFIVAWDAQESLHELLIKLVDKSPFVYGRRVSQTITGRMKPPSPWPTSWLIIVDADRVANHFVDFMPPNNVEESS